jgi:pimeloyl-ACP methyl ester carboxylesterase
MTIHVPGLEDVPLVFRRLAAWACVLAVALAGCSEISVRRAGAPDVLADWRASAATGCGLSPRTLQTLRCLDLDPVYQRCPADAFARLQAVAVQDPQRDYLFALAEMSYQLGCRAEKEHDADACASYYLCAGYAYHYLFDRPPPGPGTACAAENPFDPRFRLACDLYNAGLAKCLRAAQCAGRLDPRQHLHVSAPGCQGCALAVEHHGFAWPPQEFGPLQFCADYEVVGLDNHYRNYGLGVPLIGTRVGPTEAPGHAFYPDHVTFPVTAFFRFEESLAELGARRAGRLELYNPLSVQSVAVNGRPVGLESDLTTPLAYFLSRTDLKDVGLTGFLHADRLERRSGIYLAEPYQPGKIPVLFVHGLLSDPITWAVMYNDLLADPVLRAHYQFWFYLYPTGDPYLETAADLRRDLVRLKAALDPAGRDPALDRMVCVGHSMGGLVSKLLTVDSGDTFWHLVSARPVAALEAPPDARAEVERVFYFEHQPCVRRVIFLATPHHGSGLSWSPVRRLVDRLVHLPRTVVQTSHELVQEDPRAWSGQLPTSVDLLAPGAPALEVLAARPRPEGVHYHSIVGVAPCGSLLREVAEAWGQQLTDGVVPYASAHIDDAESELVVPADHLHVHHHPLAVREVRRILLEHLREVQEPASRLQLVGHAQ